MKTFLNVLMITMIVAAAPLTASERTNDVPYRIEPIQLPPLDAPPSGSAEPCDCIQLVFVIDVTGSMFGAINNIKAGLVDILNTANTESCGNLEAAVIQFRDSVDVLQPMTADMTDVSNAINSLSASGGNGWPEASDEALLELFASANCLNSGDFDPASWNPECCRIAVLVTDAPPAGCDDAFTPGVDDANAANIANTLGAWGIQVGALLVGGPDAQALPVMQTYASQTGGLYANVPADGTGTADAIEIIIRECSGSNETELCCLSTGCVTVLRGECLELGGIVVETCEECETIPNEQRTWSDLKTMFK